jgi:hypothetical protein
MAVPTTTFRGGVSDVVLTGTAPGAAKAGKALRAAKLLAVARNVLLFIYLPIANLANGLKSLL